MIPIMRDDSGFSLLEVVISTALLSLALAALFPIFGSAPKVLDDAMEEALALRVANGQLAEAMLKGNCTTMSGGGEDDIYSWEVVGRSYQGEDVSSKSSYPCHLTSRVWQSARPERVLVSLDRVYWVRNQ